MNVILVLIDTLRRDYLSAYGPAPLQTPAFDHLASMGVAFERHFVGSYPCMPARRDLWTGRFEFPFRGWGPLLPADTTLPQLATAAGVRTMLITDHYHLFQPGAGNYHFGFDGWEFIRGQEDDHWATDPVEVPWPAEREQKLHRRWERYWRNTARWRAGQCWRREEDAFAAQTFSAAIRWLRANAGARDPFFLLVDCFDPHEPFDPPQEYRRAVGAPDDAIPWPIYGRADRYTAADLVGIRRLYAGEVAFVDAWFGRFLQVCEDTGRLNDTVLLVTTDHGHLFGEHGMIGKPSSVHGDSNVYRPLAHVPLLAYHPAARGAGARCGALTQTVDLYPTVLEVLGVRGPGERAPQGRSLIPWLTGRGEAGSWRRHACYGKFGEAIQVTDGEFVLHQWPPRETNAPLYWYGPEPPAFLRPRGLGAAEPWPAPALGRYAVDWVRGPCQTALFDGSETQDLAAVRPAEVRRLQGALRQWLEDVGAPPEQFVRLGLA
jgi:arylsulfatase A-like enzyme